MYQTNINDLIEELVNKGYTVDYSEGDYINIARKDGIHCEFYPCGQEEDFLTGTYTIDGKETNIDVYIKEQDGIDEFLGYVDKILEVA